MDRYEVRARLGDGASGVTYRVYDSVVDEERALKVLSLPSEFGTEAFKQEFLHLASLRHEGLVRVYDFGFTDAGEAYFTMDFVDGKPIERALFEHDNSFDHVAFCKTILRVLEALEFIHRHNILHGDIKPENILIRKNADILEPVLVDFGLAVASDTESSGISGTLDYLAPEVITGARRDARSDLYALGATLYHVLAGHPPFTEGSPADLLRAHLEQTPPPLSSLDLTFPNELSDFIHTLLEKEPGRRFYSAFEAGKRLADFAGLPFDFDKPDDSTPRFSASLIGRGTELHRLLELAEQSETEARMVLLYGPEGVGKSRLLSDFRNHLLVRGARVRSTTCRLENEALAPIKKVARQILAEVGADHAAILPHAPVLHSLFPEFWKDVEEPPDLGAEGNKLRLFHALANIICLDDTIPSAIILDSLESADTVTREFWTYLASFLQAAPRVNLIILGSSRNELDGACELLPLSALNRGDTRTLVVELLGTEISESFTQAIFKQTRGNPRFIIELLEY
ncbi:MAG: protein kinase, partial [Chlorobi bacterium]|nr:protein kinase [Chlorobiota bacterium]